MYLYVFDIIMHIMHYYAYYDIIMRSIKHLLKWDDIHLPLGFPVICTLP